MDDLIGYMFLAMIAYLAAKFGFATGLLIAEVKNDNIS